MEEEINLVIRKWRLLKGSITRALTFAGNPMDNIALHEVDVHIARLNDD